MKTYRENPDGEENQRETKQNEREIFALKMQGTQQAAPSAESRFEAEIINHRTEAMNALRQIAEYAMVPVHHGSSVNDGEINLALQRIQTLMGCARSRMAQRRAWKEALKLVRHLQQNGRIE